MSATELYFPPHVVYANPQCRRCGGTGSYGSTRPEYCGWRWCECAIANRDALRASGGIQLDETEQNE